jgi:hypothetical protein
METMKIRLLTMKIRLLLTLVGLAFGFAVPALASFFQGDLAGDVKTLGEFTALRMKEDEAFNKNDAAALAALFTEDAVYVVPEGLFAGRQAIEKRYADVSSYSTRGGISGNKSLVIKPLRSKLRKVSVNIR